MESEEEHQDQKSTGHPDPERWWTNRRKGMYIGISWAKWQTFLWVALGLMDIFYNTQDPIIGKMGTVIAWSYGISALLIIGYYSNTAVEEAVKHKLGR
jgi:hypothetical protein